MLVTQAVQIFLVALMVAIFYVVFGLFTVGEVTILQWTTMTEETFDPLFEFVLFGYPVVVTRSLLVVSGFIAAFSGLQFAVSLVTDETYRNEFSQDLRHDLRELLAVRCRAAATPAFQNSALQNSALQNSVPPSPAAPHPHAPNLERPSG